MIADDELTGHVDFQSTPHFIPPESSESEIEEIERQIVILHSGKFAEWRAAGRQPQRSQEKDWRDIAELGWQLTSWSANRQALLVNQTRQLILDHWPAVERVAKLLLDRRTLADFELEAAIRGVRA